MEKGSSKDVVIEGSDDKLQITIVLAATLTMHPQILYEGKADRCHPAVTFPEGRDMSHTFNHWLYEVKHQ